LLDGNQHQYNQQANQQIDKPHGIGGKITKFLGGLVEGVMNGGDVIKELLHTAASEAVKILGTLNGYFSHAVVKILMPPKLHFIASLAKKFHLDKLIDKFVMSMNRAAEQAASASFPVFERFIGGLTVNDVSCMVGADGSAATDFFRSQTERELTSAYTPIVENAMNQCDVSRNFNELMDVTKNIPGLNHFNVNIHEYTVSAALKGLFWVLADQEVKLRKDPAGRVSKLLHQVVK
jgi:hypothetical protein